MAWQDKTLEAKYTAPSGKEFVFLYEKVSRETELKTGIYTFPDRDGAHVQHQGAGAMSFPMDCIFTGPDCMDEADAFEAALFEQEPAELQHPVYGIHKVIPTGKIKREDDLTTALNESHVSITFTETITDESPTAMEAVSAAELDERMEEFTESAAADFAEGIVVDTVAESLQLESNLRIQAVAISDNLTGLMEADASALADFKTSSFDLRAAISDLQNTYSKIKNGIMKGKRLATSIENGILNVARLSLNLLKLPSRMSVNLMEKIKGYSILATTLINQFRNDPYGINNIKNAWASMSLVLAGCAASLATGAALSIAEAAASNKSGGASASRSMSAAGASGSSSGGGPEGGGGSEDGGESGGSGGEGGGTEAGGESGNVASASSNAGGAVAAGGGGGTMSREETVFVMNQIVSLFETIKSFQDSKIKSSNKNAGSGGGESGGGSEGGGGGSEGGGESGGSGGESGGPDNSEGIIDSNSNTYLLLNELIYASIQLIQQASFSLPMQRIIRLDRDRQVIELCCELYGSVEYLDNFIIENDFNIDEIELLPMGREVTYYVQSA